MTKPHRHALTFSLAVLLPALAPASAPLPPPAPPITAMPHTAHGHFDVTLTPLPTPPGAEADQLGRMRLHKQFHGDLDAVSHGEMLAHRSALPGSAGYVAMERVEGRLAGRSGSFVLMHLGEMNRGEAKLTVQVVPDSGTGELTGLAGTMTLEPRDGQHFYALTYQLPAP